MPESRFLDAAMRSKPVADGGHKSWSDGRFPTFGEIESRQDETAFLQSLGRLGQRKWVVYAKPPFGGAQQALEYLDRYPHRVALSNDRLLALDYGEITFQWKDYRRSHRQNLSPDTCR
jgi:hypothetical protein